MPTAAKSASACSALGRLKDVQQARRREDAPSRLPGEQDQQATTVEVPAWRCKLCTVECVPVRSESRCLCGHRLKEHAMRGSGAPLRPYKTPVGACHAGTRPTAPCRCGHAKCSCPGFFFVVAEGSWILRCRCKHRHTDHDPCTRCCRKAGCGCAGFFSPWHCNCDHAWADHEQVMTRREVRSVAAMLASLDLTPQHAALAAADTAAGTDTTGWTQLRRGCGED